MVIDSVPQPHNEGGDGSRGMQDGMLTHYLSVAPLADTNIERRIEREPFDFRNMMRIPPAKR
ncbi:MAG TPA: hypothetical protein VFG05_06465 [Methylocella sp.]|nr:hypothetical protein [Methylocella sp.]